MTILARTMNDVKPNPLPGIVAAFEARGNGNIYGPVGVRTMLYEGPRGQVIAHFNQRSSLVLQHLPNSGPCVDPLTIARRYGPGNWQITIAPEQAHEWFDEARRLLGEEMLTEAETERLQAEWEARHPVDDYGLGL